MENQTETFVSEHELRARVAALPRHEQRRVLNAHGHERFPWDGPQVDLLSLPNVGMGTHGRWAGRPNDHLAMLAGVEDRSYDTVRHGTVWSYAGTVVFGWAGRRWRAVGHCPRGTAQHISQDGWIAVEEVR